MENQMAQKTTIIWLPSTEKYNKKITKRPTLL